MKLKIIVSSLLAAGALTTSYMVPGQNASPASAKDLTDCCSPTDQDFPKNGGNLGNQSYSSLAVINKSNINNLGAAWVVHTSAVPATVPAASPGTNDTQQQTTPIAVDGVVYVDTPNGDVIAVDGVTGAVRWKWHPTTATSGFGPTGTRRGVSVGGGRVYTHAAGNRVVALDQNTGQQIWAVVPAPPAGETTLGNIAKVATVYYNGVVYIGSTDGNRNAGMALNAATGALLWSFYGGAKPGLVVTDVNNVTYNAGDTWTTKNTPNDTPNTCALTGGVSPWMHPAIDPALNMVYWAFGNVRSCASSQDSSVRPGINLFSSALVAIDATTGAYKWHFQSVHHGQWDMDNTHAPVLADVAINGQPTKVVYYGSKQGRTFVLDRTNGKPVLGVEERPVVGDTRQASWPTQPYPLQPAWLKDCVVYQNLGSDIPGDVNRAVPNFNGYQASPDPAHPGQLMLTLTPGNYLEVDNPFLFGPTPRKGCMNEATWALPVLATPSQNGGADWSGHSYSQHLGLYYVPYGNNPTAHDQSEGGNGLRALGQYQTGGIVAIDGATNQIKWQKEIGLDVAHGNTPLTTATDLLFLDQSDGYVVAMDAATGTQLWRFQTGAAGSSGVITYMAGGEQYIAVAAFGTGIPYSPPGGDTLWAFKLGGSALYKDASGNVVSGSSEAPTPVPLVIRRPVGNAAATGLPANTIYLARSNGTATATKDSTSTNGMIPSTLTVPVGTTVTFHNPGSTTFAGNPTAGNAKPHCATQFFEGKFNPKLNPGESFQYVFDRAGEYFYNDCTDPRPTGKVVVTLTPQDMPGAATIFPNPMDLHSPTGVFTGVGGTLTVTFTPPAGYVLDKGGQSRVTLKTPLTTTLFDAAFVSQAPNGLIKAAFNKADIDNNVPAGAAVPLTFTANFINAGVQKQLQSTVTVSVVK